MDTRTPTRLTRSTEDRMLGGVASGLAAFLGLDPTIVRVGFALLSLFGGSGVVLYLVLWLIVPAEDAEDLPADAAIRAGVGEIRDAARGIADDVRSGWQGGGSADAPPEESGDAAPLEDAKMTSEQQD